MSHWKYQYKSLNLRLLLEIYIMHKAAFNLCSQIWWLCQVKKVKAIKTCLIGKVRQWHLTLTRSGLVRLEKYLYKTSANTWTSRGMVDWWGGSWFTQWRWNWDQQQDIKWFPHHREGVLQLGLKWKIHVLGPISKPQAYTAFTTNRFPFTTLYFSSCWLLNVTIQKLSYLCYFHTHHPEKKFSMKVEQLPPIQFNIQAKQQ